MQVSFKRRLFGKVGCVFPMVIWPEFRMGQYRDYDHQDHAPHFNFRRS